MDQTEAQRILRDIYFSAIKFRSDLKEFLPGYLEVAEDLQPWIFRPKSIVPILDKLITRLDAGAPVKAIDLYNFCFIATRLAPGLLVPIIARGRSVPEPNTRWFLDLERGLG